MRDIEIIRDARARLDTDEGQRDPTLSVYMIRDLQATKDAGLYDLAWAMSDGRCVHGEAVWLLDMLIKRISEIDDNLDVHDETIDCEHDWMIVFTIDDDRNGFYQAQCTKCQAVAPPDMMNSVSTTLRAELAARDAKSCKTCRYYDAETWYPNGRDKPAVPYCEAESCTCAPNGFDEWLAKEET